MTCVCVCTEYIYDGKTTYCWQVDSSVYATSINTSASVVESSDDSCAISMTVAISSAQVYAGDPVQISWNATANLDSKGKLRKNKFGMETLFAAAASDSSSSSQQVQIVFSRLQTCTFGVDCDPVLRTSSLVQSTSNTATNFTSNFATFSSSELVFSDAGSYSLIGHIILPGEDPKKRRYEFAVFTKVDVTAKSVATSTAPLAESQSGASQKSQGMKTEVLAVIIIGAIAGVSLAVIGFTTLRTKGKPLTATKKDFREGGFDTNAGVPTVVAGGTVEEDDFAMLSMHEVTMSSERPRANTFLAALARGQAEKNKANPVNYVGPLCQQSFQRNVITVDADSHSDDSSRDDHQPLTLETPLSSRDHMGSYADMSATPKLFSGTGVEEYHRQLKPTSHIMFNDIQEDEVVDDRSPRRKPAADLEEVSARIREHASQMLLELQEVESNSKRAAPKMTADDLRASVKVEQGRSLKLSDLGGGVQKGLYRYSEDSNYD